MGIRLVLLLLCVAQTLDARVREKQLSRACDKADVGFLLDVSRTVGEKTFHRALKIVQGLVRAFEVNPGSSRAGLVTFTDNAKTRMAFGRYATVHAFNREVRKINRTKGRTHIDKGLIEATKVLYNQKYNPQFGLKKYLFVITDGMQSEINRQKVNLKILTRLLRHQGVQIIAIAVGSTPSFWYMNQLVQFPEREVIHVGYRSKISEKVSDIHKLACSKTPTVPISCFKRADFAFLLDRSSSIGGPSRFWFEKEFVKDVLDNFKYPDVDKMTTNVAVITYAEKAEMKIQLGDYDDYDEFKDALDKNVTFRGGYLTRIDLALTMVRKEVFNGRGGDRPGVPNYVVLLTDGRQNSGSYVIDQNLAAWYAKPLWEMNITIFAIGVARAKRRQLVQLAGKNGKAIYKKTLEDLKDTVNEIIPTECLGCHKQVNLGFVLDASGTAKKNFYRMKMLVYHIIEGFKAQRRKAQVCAIRFSDYATVDIRFGEFTELRNFQVELDTALPFVGGHSYIDKGLLAAELEFDLNTDKNMPKVLIVLTDGLQTGGEVQKVKNAADKLRKKGFHIIAVSVGTCKRDLCKDVLKAIAGNEKYVFNWQQRRDNIIVKAEIIARNSCP